MRHILLALAFTISLAGAPYAAEGTSFFNLPDRTSPYGSGTSGGGGVVISGTTASPTQVTYVASDGVGLAGNPSFTYISSTNILYTPGLVNTGLANLDAQSTGAGVAIVGNSALNRGLQIYDQSTLNGYIQPNGNGVTFRCAVSSASCIFRFADSANSIKANFTPGQNSPGILGLGSLATPSVTLHITSGTLIVGPCTTTQLCDANRKGSLCYRGSVNTLYQCDGAASFAPVTYGTKVSNSALN